VEFGLYRAWLKCEEFFSRWSASEDIDLESDSRRFQEAAQDSLY